MLRLYVYVLCACIAHGAKRGYQVLWSPVTDGYELSCGFWEWPAGPQQEQPVSLTAEPSLQLLIHLSMTTYSLTVIW